LAIPFLHSAAGVDQVRPVSVVVATSALVFAASAVRLNAQQQVVVGVLEQPQCKPNAPQIVRAMFAKRGSAWEPLVSLEKERSIAIPTEWTVAFDGRERGRVLTVTPNWADDSTFYSRDRVLPLRSGQFPLRVTAAGTAFGGWCEAPDVRPLVVVSLPNAADPDGWRPFTVTRSDIERILPVFRSLRDSTLHCPNGDEKSVLFRFTSADIEPLRGYHNQHGRRLASVRLRRERNGCDGVRPDDWSVHWFELSDSVRFVTIDAVLVDAGDYDRDGTSELVFWTSGYNQDGYALFLSDLRTRFNYTWSYH
jgi:hypothetical protein